MSWLEDLLGQGAAPPAGGFQWDESQLADDARQAAAQRLARKRPTAPGQPPEDMQGEAVPYSMGMLGPNGINFSAQPSPMAPQAPAATDMPPSSNTPEAREPELRVNDMPLPRPKPSIPDAEPNAGSPMSLAPPEQADIPPNATPTIGGPAPAAAPVNNSFPDIVGGAKGILGKIFDPANAPLLLAMGGGFAGAPSFGTGMRRGLSAAAPQAALLRKDQLTQEAQNSTVKALISKGVPADLAQTAALNPEVLKQIIPQMFGAKQVQHVTIKDRMGNEIPLTFDPSTGKYKTLTGEPYGAPNASGVSSMGDPNKTGQEYLDTLDPMTRNEVKAFGEGRAPVTARNLQQMLPLVTQAYPGFQASQYPVMMATRKSYTSGKDFQASQALNTVSGHMLKLSEAAQNLPNTGIPLLNKGKNWFADTFTGSPELTKFRNALVTTSNELAKAYHGGHVSDASYSAFQRGINEAQTPAEMKAAIGEISGLLKSKIEAKESGYRSSMGDAPLPSEFKATNDEARHAFEKSNDWALGIKPNAESVPATAATTAPASQGAPRQQFKSPADVQAAITAGSLKKGDTFLDPNGVTRMVP